MGKNHASQYANFGSLLFFFGDNQSKPYICDVHNKTEVVKLLLE